MIHRNAREIVDLLLMSSFRGRHPKRSSYQFTSGGFRIEINFQMRELNRAALFTRKNAATYLQSLPVPTVAGRLTKFIQENFATLAPEVLHVVGLDGTHSDDINLGELIGESSRLQLAEIISCTDIFHPPEYLYLYPLLTVSTNKYIDQDAFFFCDPESLVDRVSLRAYGTSNVLGNSFPPTRNWGGKREKPTSWLGIKSPNSEIAMRDRATCLGALALLPDRSERYLFTKRKVFGGVYAFGEHLSISWGDPHTPALSENITLDQSDIPWLEILGSKIVSDLTSDKREMRALGYFYKAWSPDPARRFPTLFSALDSMFGDAGRATQAIIESTGEVLGDAYSYERLKLLLSVRASVIHGGAPNVYESSKYHDYYEKYDEDVTRDLEFIVATCLRNVIFGPNMEERPHTCQTLLDEYYSE